MSIRNRLLLSFGIVAAIFFLNAAFVVQKSSVIAEHSQRFVSDVWRTADGIMRARLGLNEIYRQVVEPSTGPVEQRVAAIRNQFAESRRLIENTALGEAERQGLLASLDQFADSMAAPIEQQALPGAKMESADALADPVLEKLREIADLQLVTEFNRAVMAFNDYLITHDQVEQEAFQSACGKIRESAQFGKFATEFASFEAAGRDVFVAAKSHGEAVARFRERALTLDASLQATQNTFTNTVLRPLGEQVRHVTGNIVFGTKSAGFVTLLVTGFVTWLMVRQICRPLRATTRALEEIANGDGDLSRELPATRQDELGELARAFNQFVRRIRGTVEQIRDISGTVSQAADSLSHNAHELAAGVNQTTSQSTTIAAAAEEMSLNIGRMASNSEGIFKDVRLVNEAINQVTATIADVAKNSDHAAQVAGDAAALAAAGNECIGNLGEAASEIGRVIEVIQDIAEQTNLLALNATIEAARAGEAGKGFAVVATEVKELARQTATATDDIRQRIEAIQSTATRAVQSIEGITKVIQQVKEVSCAIASAVEEQSVMARDISEKISHTSCAIGTVANGISESATATRDITQNLTGMDEVIGQTSTTANSTQTSSVQLAELAGNLQALVAQFRTQAKDATGALSA